MPGLVTVTSTLLGTSIASNRTSNFYRDIINYLGLPEGLIVAIIATAGLLFFLLFILLCSRCCFRKCCGDSTDKDKYKKRKLEPKDIDKILRDEFNLGYNESYGKIYFSLKYNFNKQIVSVKIIRLEDLPTPIDGSLDPYVVVQVKSKSSSEEKRTRIKMKSQQPVFNEKFALKLLNSEFLDSAIIFKAFDYDKYGADSLLGQLTMNIKDINIASIINTLSEFAKDLEQGEDASSGMGQICVILNNSGKAGLSVNILEAKNLRIKEDSNYSHIFVTVKLKCPHKSKKLKTISKKRSKDCHYSAFPYFNESFVFQKPHGKILNCQISIKLWASGVFKIASCIGYLLLGSEVSMESGQLHWENMLDNPRHPIAKWHVLINPNKKEHAV